MTNDHKQNTIMLLFMYFYKTGIEIFAPIQFLVVFPQRKKSKYSDHSRVCNFIHVQDLNVLISDKH